MIVCGVRVVRVVVGRRAVRVAVVHVAVASVILVHVTRVIVLGVIVPRVVVFGIARVTARMRVLVRGFRVTAVRVRRRLWWLVLVRVLTVRHILSLRLVGIRVGRIVVVSIVGRVQVRVRVQRRDVQWRR